jgi:hypothetical protein
LAPEFLSPKGIIFVLEETERVFMAVLGTFVLHGQGLDEPFSQAHLGEDRGAS